MGRFDFDLAEFPLFRFHKTRLGTHGREPLVYTDTIQGVGGGQVTRTWKAYPGPFGEAGPSAQVLLYDLFQLYVEQGARGSFIQFGTIRSLLSRRGSRNPSKRDYERLRRDMDVLRGYDFHCTNAFWDWRRRAYVDMNWRLFEAVVYFKPDPAGLGDDLPFGFIKVSTVLQTLARDRGFFSLGFPKEHFYRLKPLEQRLAVYLAKKFYSQPQHRRFVDDLARALPVEATRPADVRKAINAAALGLMAKGIAFLAGVRFKPSREGRWVVTFDRKEQPARDGWLRPTHPPPGDPQLEWNLSRIAEAVGGDQDRLWWTQCVRRLGAGAVDRALGQLREAKELGSVRNPGGLLTKIFKDIAQERGKLLV